MDPVDQRPTPEKVAKEPAPQPQAVSQSEQTHNQDATNEVPRLPPALLRRYVRHLCLLAKKHVDRKEAHSAMHKQMHRLREFSHKKKQMDEELHELKDKINLVLEAETKLLGKTLQTGSVSDELSRTVNTNKEKIDTIHKKVDDLTSMISKYHQAKTSRERKVKALEKKIEAQHKDSTHGLKAKLKVLESSYNKLKAKGADVSHVAERMAELKLRIIGLSP